MAIEIKKVEYFNITIDSNAGKAYELLSTFAMVGVSLIAFKAVPAGHNNMQFSLFPNDNLKRTEGAQNAGLKLDGPYTSLIIKSNNNEPGECAAIFEKLPQAGVNLYESSGIADIKDSYGVVLYVNQED